MALAETFSDGKTIKVKLLAPPTGTGLVKVQAIGEDGELTGNPFARHIDRLNAIDDEARETFKAWRLIGICESK